MKHTHQNKACSDPSDSACGLHCDADEGEYGQRWAQRLRIVVICRTLTRITRLLIMQSIDEDCCLWLYAADKGEGAQRQAQRHHIVGSDLYINMRAEVR